MTQPVERTAPAWRFGVLAAAGAVGTSSVVPALNDVAAALSLGPAATAGVLSAYVVPYAVAVIVAGQLCDARGPRGVLRVALVAAVVGSVVAALATTGPVHLAGRFVQGAGAGAATMAAYDVARRVEDGIARTAAVLTLGASTGPLLGGLAAQYVGWQLAVLLPGLLHATGLVALPTPSSSEGRASDRLGLLLTAVGAGTGAAALQLVRELPVLAVVLGVVAVPTLGGAAWRALHRGGRVPPAPVLRVPDLRLRGALAASIAATYFASLVLVPIALGGAGYSAIGIGLVLLPPAVSGALAARRSDAIERLLGARTDAVAAVTTLAVLLAVLLGSPLVAGLALVGLASSYGVVQPRLLAACSREVHDGPATAIGTANLVLLLGGGAGSAVVGGLGRDAGGVVLVVLVGAVALATVRASGRPAVPAEA